MYLIIVVLLSWRGWLWVRLRLELGVGGFDLNGIDVVIVVGILVEVFLFLVVGKEMVFLVEFREDDGIWFK